MTWVFVAVSVFTVAVCMAETFRLRRQVHQVRAAAVGVTVEFADTMVEAEKAMTATMAYGQFCQNLALELADQLDYQDRVETLDRLRGARFQYLLMHPAGDHTDPAQYDELDADRQPPPLLEI